MFAKILIANRGEIALRIMRTAKAMGIGSVAVHSDADARAPHVRAADEAVHIGASPASASYLVIDKILDAVRQTGAEAVHPGYGFLSENAAFAEALASAGVAFIGPPAPAIEKMGDKITSKKLADEAGVNVVPGHPDVIEDADAAVEVARNIGYPVMLKASAGGGGKGMRIAWNDDDARAGFGSAHNEATASFGDGRIFIEKFITEPRHIEIQILGDTHGNMVHLGERECSIQRRNQKVIEEAPSPYLDPKLRKAMGAQAIALARAVDYHSAGTVEFIADSERNFYFLEMNTRLQVEHPVTEMITGVDLVEAMIRIAAGEKLDLKQSDVKIDGWAVESRIYAEDPYRGFLPSTGRLTRYRPPAEGGGVRNDDGVAEGGEISIFYDPMIAKLITHAPDRLGAIDAMATALDGYRIDGIRHNIDFLTAIMRHPRFCDGKLTTAFIDEEYGADFTGAPLDDARCAVLAAIAFTCIMRRDDRLSSHVEAVRAVSIGERQFEAVRAADGSLTLDGKAVSVETDWQSGDVFFRGAVDGAPLTLRTDALTEGMRLNGGGADVMVYVRTPRAQELMQYMPTTSGDSGRDALLCPMPGVVVSVDVEAGQKVKAGEALAVVEAMKMENILRAERDVVIAEINCASGDKLAVDDVMMTFATSHDD